MESVSLYPRKPVGQQLSQCHCPVNSYDRFCFICRTVIKAIRVSHKSVSSVGQPERLY